MKNNDEKKVGARIKEYRENAGISQEFLAEKLGISSTSVSNIERGRNFPSFENFIRICNIIGIAPDLILADVVDAASVAKESELSRMLSQLPPADRKKATAIFECIIKTYSEI